VVVAPPEDWPSGESQPDEDVVMQERRKGIVSSLLCEGDKADWYYVFSNDYNRGVRVLAWVLQFANRDLFKLNSDIHGLNTRHDNDFHLPSAKLKLFQKEVFYSGIKTQNHLPKTIKKLSHDVRQFRFVLKRFIISNSFYSLEENFDINWK